MKPDERIDAALESVLRAAGTSIKQCPSRKTLNTMRAAMKRIMMDEYVKGVHMSAKALEYARLGEYWENGR